MIGDTMAAALALLAQGTQPYTTVRSFACGIYYHLHTIKPERPTNNDLRPYERVVNRCQLQGLATDHGAFIVTVKGALALARHPAHQPSMADIRRHIHCPLSVELAELRSHGNDDAAFQLAFLYWNWVRVAPEHPHRALSPVRGLGGKVVSDARQTSLPLDVDRTAGVDRANTGAPPQPPYVREHWETNDAK